MASRPDVVDKGSAALQALLLGSENLPAEVELYLDGMSCNVLGSTSASAADIMVLCNCKTCEDRPAAELFLSGGRIMSLKEWCPHCSRADEAFDLISVRQSGSSNQIPLAAWLRAASLNMGGEVIKRKQLCVFWWNRESDRPPPTVPPLPSQPLPQRKPMSGAWRSATVVGFEPRTGLYTLKYHTDSKKQTSQIFLPLAQVHFARLPPLPGNKPRNVAEGCTPLPAMLLPQLTPPQPTAPPPPYLPPSTVPTWAQVPQQEPSAAPTHPVLLRELQALCMQYQQLQQQQLQEYRQEHQRLQQQQQQQQQQQPGPLIPQNPENPLLQQQLQAQQQKSEPQQQSPPPQPWLPDRGQQPQKEASIWPDVTPHVYSAAAIPGHHEQQSQLQHGRQSLPQVHPNAELRNVGREATAPAVAMPQPSDVQTRGLGYQRGRVPGTFDSASHSWDGSCLSKSQSVPSSPHRDGPSTETALHDRLATYGTVGNVPNSNAGTGDGNLQRLNDYIHALQMHQQQPSSSAFDPSSNYLASNRTMQPTSLLSLPYALSPPPLAPPPLPQNINDCAFGPLSRFSSDLQRASTSNLQQMPTESINHCLLPQSLPAGPESASGGYGTLLEPSSMLSSYQRHQSVASLWSQEVPSSGSWPADAGTAAGVWPGASEEHVGGPASQLPAQVPWMVSELLSVDGSVGLPMATTQPGSATVEHPYTDVETAFAALESSWLQHHFSPGSHADAPHHLSSISSSLPASASCYNPELPYCLQSPANNQPDGSMATAPGAGSLPNLRFDPQDANASKRPRTDGQGITMHSHDHGTAQSVWMTELPRASDAEDWLSWFPEIGH